MMMELHLGSSNISTSRSIISKVIVHDDTGHPLFNLEYDTVTQKVIFNPTVNEELSPLIQTKSHLTTEKGVEAFGSFISGADNQIPLYRHLLTIFLPDDLSEFSKYHVTVETTLDNFNFHSSLIYSAEFYTICYDALLEFLDNETITIENYPMISSFFHRMYHFPVYDKLLAGKDLDGSDLQNSPITKHKQNVEKILTQHSAGIEGLDLYFTTISGAIIAKYAFLSHSFEHKTIHHMLYSMINSPGIYCENGHITVWFPFTKSKVGKINRAVSTTLNTLNYATAEKQMQEQVQTNIAHKFHDMVEILASEVNDTQTYGLETNIGHLVCSIRFKDEIKNNMETILQISQLLSGTVKAYGQAILAKVAKVKGFTPITK